MNLKVSKSKPVRVPPRTFTLTLTEREAAVVMFLFGQIAGDDEEGTAGHVTGVIYDALENADVKSIHFGDERAEVYNFPNDGQFTLENDED